MMAVDVEATPAADLTAISARWSDPLELAAIIVAATAESATPRGTLDEFLRSTVAAWQDDPRLSRAPASVVRAIATRLFHQMDAPAAASVSSTRLLASGAGATGMAGEALSKPALLSPRDLVILESPQSGVDPPAAGSVDLPSRSEPAVLLRMLSDAQELLLSVQCKDTLPKSWRIMRRWVWMTSNLLSRRHSWLRRYSERSCSTRTVPFPREILFHCPDFDSQQGGVLSN
ncbi:hypothetical protein DFJ73DRAFT_284798 [Zopfochytrium polystomum]|nr:hypothetical protein DFJ73DRAFT_284798 [Zopfochytrium polystomum]